MGGTGSGRYSRSNSKSLTHDYLQLDVRHWHRQNLLIPHKKFTSRWSREGETIASISVETDIDKIILSYRSRNSDDDWKNQKYSIKLSWVTCHFGGLRPWLHCPARHCGRRVAILYGGTIFACRHCYRLAYPSQRDNMGGRATRKADKIRERLGWEPGILNGEGLKPKRMHWKTFKRLRRIHNKLVNRSLAALALGYGIDTFDL